MSEFGQLNRSGSGLNFSETGDIAGAFFRPDGGNKQVNALYARRLAACWNACHGIPTTYLEGWASSPFGPREQWDCRIVDLEAYVALLQAQRDELLAALIRAERKLSAYVGVCTGDKELTGTVLPMARAAIESATKDPA